MESASTKKVLIAGASVAGLTAAWWMNRLGYQVTVVELASQPRMGGTALDLHGNALEALKRMGIYELLTANSLRLKRIEFKNADDVTVNVLSLVGEDQAEEVDPESIEVERTILVRTLLDALDNQIEFSFNNSIHSLREIANGIQVTFKDNSQQEFDLILGCDGIHSGVRKLWFGPESDYIHFLGAYGSITTVNKSLIQPGTMQWYNVPGKSYMLNAFKDKTDIVFSFLSDEISYDYRDVDQQRKLISDRFNSGWRTAALLEEVNQSASFYFVNLSQIKMLSWTKGRVALLGDAAYCPSPAAGMGGSLAMEGATTLADALERYAGDYELAFEDYNQSLRPFIDQIQAKAGRDVSENWIPRTQEDIDRRNAEGF